MGFLQPFCLVITNQCTTIRSLQNESAGRKIENDMISNELKKVKAQMRTLLDINQDESSKISAKMNFYKNQNSIAHKELQEKKDDVYQKDRIILKMTNEQRFADDKAKRLEEKCRLKQEECVQLKRKHEDVQERLRTTSNKNDQKSLSHQERYKELNAELHIKNDRVEELERNNQQLIIGHKQETSVAYEKRNLLKNDIMRLRNDLSSKGLLLQQKIASSERDSNEIKDLQDKLKQAH